ncbi:MAG TPA: diacylglycerol kinase family protein [Candidatus Paceibacterota bacterium]|jgi:diacylglycerol kinase|nr:diacylglycerol kinase family protein [Candidatus Paceibacterota bacterium]
MKEKRSFSIRARIQSSTHAWRGLGVLLKTSHNMWAGIVTALLAVYLGFILNISATEWLFLIFSIFLVFVTEALNSAIEIDIDLTSPETHPYARDTKDVAAAAVLLTTLLSLIVAFIIFLPKIL